VVYFIIQTSKSFGFPTLIWSVHLCSPPVFGGNHVANFFSFLCFVLFVFFRLLTDFVCLYTYEFWLSLCKIVRSSVIMLLPLFVLNLCFVLSVSLDYPFVTASFFLWRLLITTCISVGFKHWPIIKSTIWIQIVHINY
jgi:hypothetical protein